MKLLVLRHAKTDENIVAGWTDTPLLPEGSAHARTILHTFLTKYPELKVSQIISSDLPRAKQTAEIMAEELGVPLILNEGFRGFNIGSGAGVTQNEFLRTHPGQYIKFMRPDESIDDGETPNHFYHRVARAFRELIHNPDITDDAILVTHRSVLEVIYTLVNHIQWSNQMYYYEMEFLLADIKTENTVNNAVTE